MQDDTNISRRVVLQGAAVLGASAIVGGALIVPKAAASAQGDEKSATAQGGVQYGFLVSTSNCVDCQECVEACRRANETPEDVQARRQVVPATTGSGQSVYVSTGCMQCENPACMTVCPAAAISKGEGGIVTVDHEKCIGCKYCYQACPFGVPHY
ncbi:MAG: 4Fe-4S binding protein, partial [Raoultibacter sp.]